MTTRYYIANDQLEHKISRSIHKDLLLSDTIIAWLKKVIGDDVKDFREFTNVPMFTEDNFRLKPELRELCTKNRGWLNKRKPEAKALINDWITFRDAHDKHGVIKRWNPFDDGLSYTIRKALPSGEIQYNRNNVTKAVLLASDCPSPDKDLLTEITKIEYLEKLIDFEKDNQSKEV